MAFILVADDVGTLVALHAVGVDVFLVVYGDSSLRMCSKVLIGAIDLNLLEILELLFCRFVFTAGKVIYCEALQLPLLLVQFALQSFCFREQRLRLP